MSTEIVMVISWFLIMVVFVVIEVVSFNLLTIWFAIATIPPLIMAVFGASLLAQIIVFIICSVALLLATRPIVKRMEHGKKIKTNYEAYIDEEGVAIDSFAVGDNGYVKVRGLEWLAFSTTDDITKGDRIIVKAITGSRARVIKKP